jgi:hypothetical protein
MSNYASVIHQTACDLALAGFGTRFKSYRKTPALQVAPGDLPMLGIYILRETRAPWGSANHAEPRFENTLTLGFSGGVQAETDKQNELHLIEEWMSELDDILLTNSGFVNLCSGITGMDRQAQFAKIGETTLYEVRVEMTMVFQSYFPPKVVDDFKTLHVTTQYPDQDHVDSGTPQITRVYELDQES